MLGVKALPVDPAGPDSARVPVRLTRPRSPSSRPGHRVALRQLIIATDEQDFGLPAWTSILGKIGTPYDVVFARTKPLDSTRLVRRDGVGRYNAVLLTSSTLSFRETTGGYRSALKPAEWRTLWEYERTYAVRQVALNGSPRVDPEDYCLRLRDEGPTGPDPVTASLTAAGARVFDQLAPDARLPLANAYVYRSRLAASPGCAAEPLLTIGSDVVGVLSRAADGRDRIALTFTLGAEQPIEDLLGFGLVRWATRGVFLGEHRHWINVDIDDWFNTDGPGSPDKEFRPYRLNADEVLAIKQQQQEFRELFPLAAGFTLNLAYNGRGAVVSGSTTWVGTEAPDPLAGSLACLRETFRWINHTFTHEVMNSMSYERSRDEIKRNLDLAAELGLPVPHGILKTPEYSGLGVFNPDVSCSPLAPITDFGLGQSNTDMLRAAKDLGIRYLHGNMSFRSHRPDGHNCGFYHPLEPELFVIPDWPTNIAWEATAPEEAFSRYHAFHGRDGAPAHSTCGHDPDYDGSIDAEAELALRHVMAGSAYAHTLHQANLRQYAPGRSLAFDWLNALLAKYSSQYRVPLKNPDWPSLAGYVETRTAHVAALRAGPDAVWNRDTNTIEYLPRADTSLFVTGLVTRAATEDDRCGPDTAEIYGADTVSRLRLTEGQAVTLLARPRP